MIREFIQADLLEYNSFHVPAHAARLVMVSSEAELRELFDSGTLGEWYVLGGGNNILFTHDYAGTLIKPVAKEIRIVSQTDDRVTIDAEAGLEWDDLVEWCVPRGLWGIENLSCIPGKVGAAPVQNIGAYGCEVKDVLESVTAFLPETKETRVFTREECRFGYRDSLFKRELRGRVIILSVRLVLSCIPHPQLGYGDVAQEVVKRGGATLHHIREAIRAIRTSKLPDPAVTGNAGSFFKNPVVSQAEAERLLEKHPDMPHYPAADGAIGVKLAAGWLIDRAGLKGFSEGHVGVHPRQALVLINLGGATGEEVLAFARCVQAQVKQQFGVAIEPEVNVL